VSLVDWHRPGNYFQTKRLEPVVLSPSCYTFVLLSIQTLKLKNDVYSNCARFLFYVAAIILVSLQISQFHPSSTPKSTFIHSILSKKIRIMFLPANSLYISFQPTVCFGPPTTVWFAGISLTNGIFFTLPQMSETHSSQQTQTVFT
jgi:hypothetical protein